MEEISISSSSNRPGNREQLAPKTILQLAEEEAVHQDKLAHTASESQSLPASAASDNQPKRTVRTVKPSTTTSSRIETPPARSSKGTKGQPSSDARRTRKRARLDADADDSGEKSEEDDASTRSSSVKRSRANPPPTPVHTRVLRTRTPKSAAKIQEEKEMEEAYRRAISR